MSANRCAKKSSPTPGVDGDVLTLRVGEPDDAEAGLGAEHLHERVDGALHGVPPVVRRRLVDAFDHGVAVPLQRSIAQRLQEHDAVGEVPVDGSDGCVRALGHHRGRETVETDLVDDFGGGVQKRIDARGTAFLDGLGTNERYSRLALAGREIIDGH